MVDGKRSGDDGVTPIPDIRNPKGGIQSLDAALVVLNALADQAGPVPLSVLARNLGMPASKIHRYLASFIFAGLARQDVRTGRYDLGANAARMGIAALGRHELIANVTAHLWRLRDETGLTAFLSVWGPQGPTVVHWQRATSPVVAAVSLGSTLPLLTSASGRVSLAYLPKQLTHDVLRAELGRVRPGEAGVSLTDAAIEEIVERVRRDRMAAVDGRFIPGLCALSAPITDWQGEAEAVVTLFGVEKSILDPDSTARLALDRFTRDFSIA